MSRIPTKTGNPKTPPPTPASRSPAAEPIPDSLPDVSAIVRRLRKQHELTLQDVADRSGLSQSFISDLERGATDISLRNLARLARVFNHDVGSLLGYSTRQSEPHFVSPDDRFLVERGKGVRYEVIRLPGLSFELITASFDPGARFRDQLTHEGIDIGFVPDGELVLVYNGLEYTLRERDCAVWSGAYPHTLRNDTNEPAQFFSIVTETVF